MGFNTLFSTSLASFIIFLRRAVHLIWSPYRALRTISLHTRWGEVMWIAAIVYMYFQIANAVRPYSYEPEVLFLMSVVHLILIASYFYFFTLFTHKESDVQLNTFIYTFSYTLIPTLIWFSINSFLYAFIPPPRTDSLKGTAFSVIFIAFSIAILLWKVIVMYLAIRFSSKLAFYRIIYAVLIFLMAWAPYTVLLYRLDYFRIPFM